MPKIVGGGRPFPPNICAESDPHPFVAQRFRPISAHSASTVIASDKSSISTHRKSTTRFPTSHRWTVYVTPKSPKGCHKNAISLFVPVQFNFSRKKSATKFLCMKTSSGKVVATSFLYPMVHRSIADDVPIYLKLVFKLTHPFRKRRFPKLATYLHMSSFRTVRLPPLANVPAQRTRRTNTFAAARDDRQITDWQRQNCRGICGIAHYRPAIKLGPNVLL